MNKLNIDIANITGQISQSHFLELKSEIERCNLLLESGEGEGAEFLGWVDLPSRIEVQELAYINLAAKQLQQISDIIIVIGIGGSYLGARAIIEAMNNNFDWLNCDANHKPKVIFAGQNLSEDYYYELLNATKKGRISVVVISKSGTTTEPAIAFRIIKTEIEERYGEAGSRDRIVVVTDGQKGVLRSLAKKNGYRSLEIPDNVGGRFSIFTPVGLLPIAAAGFNITEFVTGAKDMQQICDSKSEFSANPAAAYAMARTYMYRTGKKIEVLASYDPKLLYISEWWKQLFGESEGKNGHGIFPASVTMSADLHSMGQYIQDGERTLFETVISVDYPRHRLTIKAEENNADGLNYLAGRRISEVNKMAEVGARLAHIEGGVPNILITMPTINEYYLGGLVYMFERACGISSYALGVNPFDQPGVEAYKNNMFALLEKPGYEDQTEAVKKKLAEKV